MILPNGTLLQGGKYRIEEKIGQGGFGITYRACQPLMLDRKVCIKEFYLKQCFSRESTSSAITYPNDSARKDAEIYQQKFIKEAQTLYSMHHPNIMEIYDIFEENNTAYYVMEYIEGESLKDMLVRRGSIPEAEAIGYIRKVAEALKYIHSRNFNHFDVKPDNILVRSSDKEVILIDFGTAKHYDSNTGNATTMTAGLLSRGYAPIEQYKEGGVSSFTPETDIYALGATLYKLLTGNTPPEPTEIISNGIPELPSSVSQSTKDLIKWAMQLNKTDRPHSCDEFMNALPSNVEGNVTGHKNDADDATVSIGSEETTYINKPSENNEETEFVKHDKGTKTTNKGESFKDSTHAKSSKPIEQSKFYAKHTKASSIMIWMSVILLMGELILALTNQHDRQIIDISYGHDFIYDDYWFDYWFDYTSLVKYICLFLSYLPFVLISVSYSQPLGSTIARIMCVILFIVLILLPSGYYVMPIEPCYYSPDGSSQCLTQVFPPDTSLYYILGWGWSHGWLQLLGMCIILLWGIIKSEATICKIVLSSIFIPLLLATVTRIIAENWPNNGLVYIGWAAYLTSYLPIFAVAYDYYNIHVKTKTII